MTLQEAAEAVYAAYDIYSEAIDNANKVANLFDHDADFGIKEKEKVYLDLIEAYNYMVLEHHLDALSDI